MSDIERKGISTSEEATLRCHIAELERNLLFANDALAKCDLARQNAGGMEMQIQELEHKNTELKAYLRLYDQSDQLTTEPELRKSLIETGKERDHLRLQVVRLREALKDTVEFDPSLHHVMEGTMHTVSLRAILAETPAQSAKEVLSPVLELLKRLHDDYLETPDMLRLIEQEIQRLERPCK